MEQYSLVARWLQGHIPKKILPWQIDIDTTNICNQDCYYCYTSDFREQQPVYQTSEQYIKLIDQLYNWNKHDFNTIGTISNVIFSGGGEPTLLPRYEEVIEHTIDCGYVAAMNTNGTKLDKLLTIAPHKLKRMAYIGLDIDSAIEYTYEEIRRSKMAHSPFNKVKEIAKELGKMGAPIYIKALLMPQNTTDDEIRALVLYAKEVNAREIHARPVVLNEECFTVTPSIIKTFEHYASIYNVKVDIRLARIGARDYKQCHQFFLFPSFSADGKIYVCCEYKGREDICLGSWVDDDWRDLWCGEKHKEIYKHFKTVFCRPCRPNHTNNQIEYAIKDYNKVLRGFI